MSDHNQDMNHMKELPTNEDHICHDMWVVDYYWISKFIHGFIEE